MNMCRNSVNVGCVCAWFHQYHVDSDVKLQMARVMCWWRCWLWEDGNMTMVHAVTGAAIIWDNRGGTWPRDPHPEKGHHVGWETYWYYSCGHFCFCCVWRLCLLKWIWQMLVLEVSVSLYHKTAFANPKSAALAQPGFNVAHMGHIFFRCVYEFKYFSMFHDSLWV